MVGGHLRVPPFEGGHAGPPLQPIVLSEKTFGKRDNELPVSPHLCYSSLRSKHRGEREKEEGTFGKCYKSCLDFGGALPAMPRNGAPGILPVAGRPWISGSRRGRRDHRRQRTRAIAAWLH